MVPLIPFPHFPHNEINNSLDACNSFAVKTTPIILFRFVGFCWNM